MSCICPAQDGVAGVRYEVIEEFLQALCRDIKQQRARLGGNWVVAMVVDTRQLRDIVRAQLPELTFLVMELDQQQLRQRIAVRHSGDQNAIKAMEVGSGQWIVEVSLFAFRYYGDVRALIGAATVLHLHLPV